MILADGDWTWSDLARELREKYKHQDIDELIYFLSEGRVLMRESAYLEVCEKQNQRILDLEKKLRDIYTQQVTPGQIDFHLKDGPNG